MTPIANLTSLDIRYARNSSLPPLLTLTTDFETDAVSPNGSECQGLEPACPATTPACTRQPNAHCSQA